MSKKISFAVVGAGHIGKRHSLMISNNPEAKLVAIADIRPELKGEINSQFNVPFFSSLSVLLGSGLQIDVICVCTPNGEHAAQAIKVLKHKCHVVLEKPMALHKADCEEIISQSKEAGKLVFCVMQNRYSPPSVWLKEVISSHRLGKINMVMVNCLWNRDERYYKNSPWKGSKKQDGGTLFTQFSHYIDTLYWLFGDIKNIKGKFHNFNHEGLIEFEDSGFVNFDFISGGSCSLNYTTSVWDKNLESSLTIVGEKGSIKVGGQYMEKVEFCHIENYVMPELKECMPANDYGHYKGSAANHQFVIENVIDTILERNVATTNVNEGLKVVEMIERIYESGN